MRDHECGVYFLSTLIIIKLAISLAHVSSRKVFLGGKIMVTRYKLRSLDRQLRWNAPPLSLEIQSPKIDE
jgi:hypothetical protein